MIKNLKHIIESLLFVADEPIAIRNLKEICQPASTGEIRAALNELTLEYEERGGGFHLSRVAGGFQLRSRPQYNEWIRRLLKPKAQRLSNAALETLAIVAYRQPLIRSDIEKIRGVDCGGILRLLMERKLIRILGRKEIPGRPLIYTTTKLFLEVFNLNDLSDLPSTKEIEALKSDADSNTAAPDRDPPDS